MPSPDHADQPRIAIVLIGAALLTNDLIACRVSLEVGAFIVLRLPIPAREQIVLALFRHDLATAMRLLRQSIL